MAYGFQSHGGAQALMDELDFFDIHMLPFFSQKASTGTLFYFGLRHQSWLTIHLLIAKKAWPIVTDDLKWFTDRAKGKKVVLSQVSK
jgi:hypothetical protein